jgi:hypothetical protein
MLGIELMQQLMLPIIPQGTTVINGQVSVDNRNDEWFYFLDGIPIYSHQADNKKLFRLHTSQLINAGSCCKHRPERAAICRMLKKSEIRLPNSHYPNSSLEFKTIV